MLSVLLESKAPPQRRRGGVLTSVAIHTAVIVGAVAATASARGKPSAPDVPHERPPVYVEPHRLERRSGEAAVRPSQQRTAREIEVVAPSARLTLNPIRAPIESLGEVDPRSLLRLDSIRSSEPFHQRGGEGRGPSGDEPATTATVDKAAALLAPPRPRYPEVLRRAGVAGRVVVRFVVDTLGQVEPASIAVRESSHDLFEQAVRAVLPSLRFAPAEVGGRKVRMLVDLPFEFRLDR